MLSKRKAKAQSCNNYLGNKELTEIINGHHPLKRKSHSSVSAIEEKKLPEKSDVPSLTNRKLSSHLIVNYQPGRTVDSGGNLMVSIISHLKRKVDNFKQVRMELEKTLDSETSLVQLNKVLLSYEERKLTLSEELDYAMKKKKVVIKTLDLKQSDLSYDEKSQLELIRHKLELETINLQFEVYSLEIDVVLVQFMYMTEKELMLSQTVETNQKLEIAQEVLKQCVIAAMDADKMTESLSTV